MTSNLTELINAMDQTRKQMEQVVKGTDPAREIYPGWTIKEILGHITTWEIVIHKGIQAFRDEKPPFFIHNQDFDVFNAEAVEYRSAWSLEQVIEEWRDVRKELRDMIQELEESLLPQEMVTPWGSDRTLHELIEIIVEHESEHMEDIQKTKH
jgi:hypothetical protein